MLRSDYLSVIVVEIYCCLPNVFKFCLCIRPPDVLNCWRYNASLLGNGRCPGNSHMAYISDTSCTVIHQVSSKSFYLYLSCRVFNILQYGGRPPFCIIVLLLCTTHEVKYVVLISCVNLISIIYFVTYILWCYNFAALAGKCVTAPSFWLFLVVFNASILCMVTETAKRHIVVLQRVI